MTDNTKLIERLKAVIETALTNSASVEHDRAVGQAEHNAFKVEQDEAEAVRDLIIAALTPTDDEREAITDEALWDFAGDLLDAWNIEDLNPPSLTEMFRDRFVARFRRFEVPEPSTEPRPCHLPQSAPPCIGCQCETQGEPSETKGFAWYISWVDQHRPNATPGQRALMYRTFLSETRISPSDAQTLDWARAYARRYWQLGGEPETQRALTILTAALSAASSVTKGENR